MDDDQDDRKPTREEKEQAKVFENLEGDESEKFLMQVVAQRAAAASKSVHEDDDMSNANRDDINISRLLHQMQEEDKEKFLLEYHQGTIEEKTVLVCNSNPTKAPQASSCSTGGDSGAIIAPLPPGAYAAEPGQGLVRQETGKISVGSSVMSLSLTDDDRCDIECPPLGSPEGEELAEGDCAVESPPESRPCCLPDTDLLLGGGTSVTSTTDYLASAHLVKEETDAPEAQPLDRKDLLLAYLDSSTMAICLILTALLFGIGITVSLILAMFVWYEPAFLLATALAFMILLAQASAVRARKIIVISLLAFFLLTIAGLVCYGVYWSSRRHEEQLFDSEFLDVSTTLVDGFHDNARLRLQVMDMLSVSITSYALSTNQTWPFVVIPDFDAKATAARTLLGSINAGLYPYVTQETRSSWETFSMENLGWINASRAYQEDFRHKHNRSQTNSFQEEATADDDYNKQRRLEEENPMVLPAPNVSWTGTDGASPELFRYGRREGEGYLVVEDSPGPYYPMWHLSPIREYTESYINYNCNDPYLGDAYTNALESVRTTKSAVFGGVWNVDEEGEILEDDDYDTRTVPAAAVIYPIFDTIIGENRNVVGLLEFDLQFGPYFEDILSRKSHDILCVVSNPCGQTFSYVIDGASATYRGPFDASENGDLIVREDMVRRTLITSFDTEPVGDAFYSGAPVNKEHCPWTLSVYPTREFEAEFVTDAPLYYALVVGGVFLLTCFGFVAMRVARRQPGREQHIKSK